MKKTAVKLVALVATALLLLSGCAKNNPNVAATVGGVQISVAEVDAVAKVVAAKSPESPKWGSWRAPVLQVMLVSKLGMLSLQQAGATVSAEQRQQVYAQNELYAALASDPASAQFMAELADATVLLSDTTGQQIFAQVVTSTSVQVNPAFGVWDSSQGKLSGETGSLSTALTTEE